jgi:hypothetical protein
MWMSRGKEITMSTINFQALGFNGPSTFFEAGAIQDLKIGTLAKQVEITGGVIIGNPTGPPEPYPVLYGTADTSEDASSTLKATITITFAVPTNNFQVVIINGDPHGAFFRVSDGNPADDQNIFLQANSSEPFNVLPVAIANTHGAKVFTITDTTASASGFWDFFIDNISYNYSAGEVLAAKGPGQNLLATINETAATASLVAIQLAAEGGDINLIAMLLKFEVSCDYLTQLAQDAISDPPDPNYKQPYTPTFFQFSPIQSDSTITPHTAADANADLKDMSLAIGYMQALVTTMNRLGSATSAGDQASITLQTAELDTFLTLASSSLAAVGKDMNTLANDFTGVSLPTITAAQIASFVNNVKINGVSALPQQEQSLFQSLGVSSTDLQGIISALGSIDPSSVPTSLVSGLQQASASLQTISNIYSGTSTSTITAQTIQNDYLGITRTALDTASATTEANSINAGSTSETAYVNSLLAQVTNTTIPAVAVEASMYGVTGSSAEITKLVTQYLPAQVANAMQNGYNPQVYACEALGLVFAFGNENGGMGFATNFGPSQASMPNTTAGDAAFAVAAASTIFGSAATANTPGAIAGFVANWKAFFTAHGVVGIPNATAAQIDLAARGAAWGDAVGIAFANNLGPLPGQVTNFLEDAAQGSAMYAASLTSQPNHAPFQGSSLASEMSLVGLSGQAQHVL